MSDALYLGTAAGVCTALSDALDAAAAADALERAPDTGASEEGDGVWAQAAPASIHPIQTKCQRAEVAIGGEVLGMWDGVAWVFRLERSGSPCQ